MLLIRILIIVNIIFSFFNHKKKICSFKNETSLFFYLDLTILFKWVKCDNELMRFQFFIKKEFSNLTDKFFDY